MGTEDLIISNYSFTTTPGFTATVVANGSLANVTYTSGLETDHGKLPPQSGSVPSGGLIYWNGIAYIPDQGTITFSFNHPNAPWDQEWFTNSAAGWTISDPGDPIPGPTGIYTYGFLHGPGQYAAQEFQISCEGIQCTGGGTYKYQYTLKNISNSSVTLTDLFIGTQDPNIANYSFVPTTGFSASIVPNNGSVSSVLYTSQQESPHGQLPPQSGGVPSGYTVYWTGSTVVPATGTVTFAFDHPNVPWDHE